MSIKQPQPQEEHERDLIDAIPGLNRVATNLQRAVGPSCFLSLIISALIIVLLRRYVRLPLPGMVILTFAVWWCTLVILVRLSGPNPDDDW
jgi:hypothetical protein